MNQCQHAKKVPIRDDQGYQRWCCVDCRQVITIGICLKGTATGAEEAPYKGPQFLDRIPKWGEKMAEMAG